MIYKKMDAANCLKRNNLSKHKRVFISKKRPVLKLIREEHHCTSHPLICRSSLQSENTAEDHLMVT